MRSRAKMLTANALAAWALDDALVHHSGLALIPDSSHSVVLRGVLRCWVIGPDDDVVDDSFALEIRIPPDFPARLPRVYETAARIPQTFHHLDDQALCLGSNTAQLLAMGTPRTIRAFLDYVVVPYLYGFLRFEMNKPMPFGELRHGATGLEDEVRRVFRMPAGSDALRILVLAGQRRRVANKRPCPCGSGRRLGRCHQDRVHRRRCQLGRVWFRREAIQLSIQRERRVDAKKERVRPRWMRR